MYLVFFKVQYLSWYHVILFYLKCATSGICNIYLVLNSLNREALKLGNNQIFWQNHRTIKWTTTP